MRDSVLYLLQELLSHAQTNADLEGELGNTPVMVACSTDNHKALHILVSEAK